MMFRSRLLVLSLLLLACCARLSHADIAPVAGGFLFTGTNASVVISATNGSILSIDTGGDSIAVSGAAGLWSLAFTTNGASGQLGELNASSFSPGSPTHAFSWSLPAPSNVLFLTYSNEDALVTVALSNRPDGVEMKASVSPVETNVMTLTLPAPLRFDPADLTRFIAPNHSSDGVGMAYHANYFVAQDEDDPASWKTSTVGPGGYQTLYGGNLIFGDYVATNLLFTTNGVAWLGTTRSNTWSGATAVVNRPPAPGQADVVLIDSPNGAFLSGSHLGGGPGAGYLMRIGGAVDAGRVPLSLDVVVGAIEHLATNAGSRTKMAMLSMVRGPVVGENWPSEVRLDQWRARLNESAILSGEGIVYEELNTLPELIAALNNTNYFAILNPYGELLPASLGGGVPATVTNIGNFVRGGGHWFEVAGHPFFQALQPELYYTNNIFYPPVFADFFQLETSAGHVSLFGVQPASDEPWAGATNAARVFVPGRLIWGGDTNGGWMQRSFGTFVPPGQTWTSPSVRLAVGQTVENALQEYAAANHYHRDLDDKVAPAIRQSFQQSVLIHFKGSATQMTARLDDLPAPALLHFEEYLYGGFDKQYPDHLPPAASFGTIAEFTNFLGQARARNLLTMPYTNPTFWGVDPKGPTFLATNDAPLFLNLDGSINLEIYFGEGGFTVTPWHPAVQAANRNTRNQFITNYPVDFIFHDQLGARTWQYDLNPAAPTPYAYLDGLVNIAAEDSASMPLSTENGYDRLINNEAQFAGLAWGLAPTTNAPFWRRYLRDRFSPATWEIFPLAQHLAHDKVAFTYNNLDAAVHNHEVMAWTLGLGYGMTYVLPVEDLDDVPRRQWLRWIDRMQKSVAARYIGRGVQAFDHQWGTNTLDPDNGVIAARYGDVDIVANLAPQPLSTNGWTLAPNGYLATADGLVAGYLHPTGAGATAAYIAATNDAGGLDLWIYSAGNTNVTLILPPGFNGPASLSIEGGPVVATQIVANTLAVPLGAAATPDAYLWHGALTFAAEPQAVFLVDFGRHDSGTNGLPTASPDINGNYWNNIGSITQAVSNGTKIVNMVTTTNGASSVGIEMITAGWEANGTQNGGLLNPSSALLGELAITNATHDYFFTTVSPSFRISGLDTARTYNLTFFGSRQTTNTRISAYTVGSVSTNVQTSGAAIGDGGYNGNNNKTATLSGLVPNASGRIDVTLSVNAGGFAYLGILKIEEFAPVAPAPVAVTQAVYRVDFGRHDGGVNGTATANPDANGNYWNNIGPTTEAVPNGTSVANLVNTTNGASTIDLELTSAGWRANGKLNGGLLAPSPALLGELAIATATEDYFFTQGTDTIRISSLNPARRYNLRFFGTRSNTSTRITTYSAGFASTNLQTSGTAIGDGGYNGNNNKTVTLAALAPNPSGEIDLTVSAHTGGFAYLGILEIEEFSPASSTNPGPSIAAQPAILNIIATNNAANPAPQTLTISNNGVGTLTFTLATNANWLTVSPVSGTLAAGASQIITVSVNATGRPLGMSGALIQVHDPNATNGPQFVSVNLQVKFNGPLLAVFGSSVAKGWNSSGHMANPDVFVTGGSWSNSYAALITQLLAGQGGPAVTNVSTPGDNTAAGLGRFDTYVKPLAPNYVLIAYALGNEGLASSPDDATSSNIVATFTANLWNLVGKARSNNIIPVISSVYPHGQYNAGHYAHLKRMHLTINEWDVPSLNLLTPVDDGAGQWLDGYWSDDAHPNDAGYAEFFYNFVPSLFDAMAAGKTNSPAFGSPANYARLSASPGVTAPLTFTPSNTVHSFTTAFRFRTAATGTLAAVRSGADHATLEARAGQLVYVTRSGAETVIATNVLDNTWRDIALSGRYALSNTALFVDGQLVASIPERFTPDQFILGGPGASGRAATPAVVDLQSWCVYRAGWTPDEAFAHANGALQQSSMEIGSMLGDAAFTNGAPAANAAQSLSEAVVQTSALEARTSGADTTKLLIFGSSVAKGWNGGGAITNGSYEFGYAGRLTPVVEATGWTVTNASVGGDNTSKLLARFDTNAIPENPDIIVIGLSLGNEGLLGDSETAYESFRSGMTNLIHRSRTNGFYPVITHVYPHTAYNATHYAYVKRMNLLLNSWDVPGVNLLGSTDDGTGKWVTAYRSDDAHPNADGHALMYEAIVPTLFDAIRAGKTNTPSLLGTHGFTRTQGVQPAPLAFTPAQPIRSFNAAFRVRATSTGTVAAVLTATNGPAAGGAIELRGNALVYVATNGALISAPVDADAGRWIDVALSHSFARGLTLLYVDGVLAGTTTEHLAPAQFVLGGHGGLTARPPAPASLDLQDWCVYRGPWTPEEAMAQHTGALQQASMEIGAPLNDPAFALGASATNRAQSLSLASITGTNLTAGPIVLPPGNLQATSPAFNTVALTWTDTSGTETGFVIERRPANGTSFWSNLVTLAANAISHTDTNLPAGTYQYRVASVEGALLSEYSGVVSATVTNAPYTDPSISYREWASDHFALAPDIYRIDFNTNVADYGGQLWNTVTSLTATTAYRLTSAATTEVGVTISVTDDFSDFRSGNGAPLAEYDNDPQASYFGINAAGAQVLLSNLNRNATFDAVVFSRRGAAFPGFDYRTVFTFTGGGADVGFTVDAASNVTPVRVFGLKPDEMRTLALDVRGPASPTGTVFGGINFLVVRELNGPGPFLIDFNTAANPTYPAGEIWNTIDSLTDNTPYALADHAGDTSAGYTFTLDDGFDQFRADNGDLVAGFSGTAENSSFALRDDVPLTARLTIAGLDTNLLYDITFLARRGSLVGGFDYGGTYTFTGAVTTVITVNGATNTTYTDVPGLAPDANGRISLTITAGPGAGTDFPVINLLRFTSAGPRTGPVLSGPYDDPTGNGLPNLLAYGQNQAPAAAIPLALENPVLQPATGQFSVTYDRNAYTHQIDYTLENTTNLLTGLWIPDLTATASILATDGTNQTIRLQRTITETNLYLRLAAEFTP